MWNLRAMGFELRQARRQLESPMTDCLLTSQRVAETSLSGDLQQYGGQRGHTCSDGFRADAVVVMRKIVSCVLSGEGWRSPQSKLSRSEAFDQYHRAAALRTSPERRW